tara:strand:+ start:325 stop:552 length:228 start_codon:yes stop_codon:yes gene_type:complete
MADRNQLAQEKAEILKQVEEISSEYKVQLEELNKATKVKLEPLEKKIVDINNQILASVDEEAGVASLGEACPANA